MLDAELFQGFLRRPKDTAELNVPVQELQSHRNRFNLQLCVLHLSGLLLNELKRLAYMLDDLKVQRRQFAIPSTNLIQVLLEDGPEVPVI